jgi:hypothetical protein
VTDTSGTEWTVATLHALMVSILDERDKRYAQRFTDLETALRAALAASEKAIGKAEVATERRFEGVNEFRQTLSDQAAQFMTRSEAVALTDRNTERIQDQAKLLQALTDRVNRSEGRGSGFSAGWGYLVAAVGLIATVVVVVIAVT